MQRITEGSVPPTPTADLTPASRGTGRRCGGRVPITNDPPPEKTNSKSHREPPSRINIREMFHNEEFSDITLLARSPEYRLHLHKNIITQTSGYFQQVMTKDKKLKFLEVKEIRGNVLCTIARWQYDHQLQPFSIGKAGVFSAIYKACDKLVIPALKTDILKKIELWCQDWSRGRGVCKLGPNRKRRFCKFFSEICRLSSTEDSDQIARCAYYMVAHCKVCKDFFGTGGAPRAGGAIEIAAFDAAFNTIRIQEENHRQFLASRQDIGPSICFCNFAILVVVSLIGTLFWLAYIDITRAYDGARHNDGGVCTCGSLGL
ncbi:hypothetical protein TWF718_005352 [Orbilia javanica]|uniref:BTB domain-containing protein n=1 Tax=Orbilia javanica TaxID=47235 RepID=A0AAN8NWS3_9PEZI